MLRSGRVLAVCLGLTSCCSLTHTCNANVKGTTPTAVGGGTNGEPSDLPAGATLVNNSTPYIELWRYIDTKAPRSPSGNYTSVLATGELNSSLSQSSFLAKFGQAIGFTNTKTVTVSVQKNGGTTQIVLLGLTETPNAINFSPVIGAVVVGPRTYSGFDTLELDFKTSYGDAAQSSLVSNALTAAKTISLAVGAVPAATVISAIPSSATHAGDTLIGSLTSNNDAFNPDLTLSASDFDYNTEWDFVIFDKPSTGPGPDVNRTWLADIRIALAPPNASLLAQMSNGKFAAGLGPRDIEDVDLGSDTLANIVAQKYPNAGDWYKQDYTSYQTFCQGLPNFLGGAALGLNQNDIYAAEWGLLSEATGGASFTDTDVECPSQEDLNQMAALGLDIRKLSVDDALATRDARTAEMNNKLGDLSTDWVNRGQNPKGGQDLDALINGFVTVNQSVAAIPGITLNQDTAQGARDLEQILSNVNGAMKITSFKYELAKPLEGEASLVVGNQSYYLLATFDGSLHLKRLDIQKKDFFA